MTIKTFFTHTNLNNSLLIGYYGGGNFGDELLLEVLFNLLDKTKPSNISFYYANPNLYQTFHADFGYRLIDGRKKLAIVKSLLRAKNIIVGGGGIWGLDFSKNNFLLSLLLFLSNMLGKKIFLIGVGYYASTTRLGHIGAFLAAKASTLIIARDTESYTNFRKFFSRTIQDTDIANHVVDQFTRPDYDQNHVQALANQLPITEPTIVISLRRFQKKYQNRYTEQVLEIIKENADKPFLLLLLEPREVDPDGYKILEQTARAYPNVRMSDFRFNPLTFVHFLQAHRKQILLISPQFHSQLIALKSGITFLPISYDNKVTELFRLSNVRNYITIQNLTLSHLQTFIDNNY